MKEVDRLPILSDLLFKSVETVFHPEAVLILVSDKRQVYLWNFLDGNYPPYLPFLKVTCREGKTFAQIHSSATANSEILGTTFTEVEYKLWNGPIHNLKISECGDYVVLFYSARTTVVKIPSKFLERKSVPL